MNTCGSYTWPFVQARYRPSGLKTAARQNLLVSGTKVGCTEYGTFKPAELQSWRPLLERTENE